MFFTEDMYDRGFEQMMRVVPNFYPRGSGVFVSSGFKYTPEICDCKYCEHFSSKKGCKVKSLSAFFDFAFSSINTQQCSSISLFLLRLAMSWITSCKLPSASTVSLISLLPVFILLARVAFEVIFFCS